MKDFWDGCASYYDLACNDDVEAEEAFFPAWVDEADAAAGPIPSGGREELSLDEQQIIEDFLASCRRPGDGADVHSAAQGSRLAVLAEGVRLAGEDCAVVHSASFPHPACDVVAVIAGRCVLSEDLPTSAAGVFTFLSEAKCDDTGITAGGDAFCVIHDVGAVCEFLAGILRWRRPFM